MTKYGAVYVLAGLVAGCTRASESSTASPEPKAIAPGPSATPYEAPKPPSTEPAKNVADPVPDKGKSQTGSNRVSAGAAQVTGALPPEVIQRIVRQSFDRFQTCYDAGLRSNPTLQGRVTVKFVIAKDGSTKSANVAATDLDDKNVATCVAKAFSSLSFPPPDRGEVIVSYPVVLSPDGSGAPGR